MAFNYLSERNWRAELIVNNVSYGFWDRDELTFGSESGEVTDPEDGQTPIGGRQTADDLNLSRPFKRPRDENAYRALKQLRGRGEVKLPVWMLDDSGNPVSSTPIDTLEGVFQEVTLPGGNAGGNDPSRISCVVSVRA